MEKANRCQVCGGDIQSFAGGFNRCKYCGQIYTQNGSVASEEMVYQNAVGIMKKNTVESNKTAAEMFNSISGYQNSSSYAAYCIENNKNIAARLEQQRLETIRNQEIAEQKRIEELNRQKKKTRILFILSAVVIISIIAVVTGVILNNRKIDDIYDEAVSLYESGKYEEAQEKFESIKDKKDTGNYLQDINKILDEKEDNYKNGTKCYQDGKYSDAISYFILISDYKDSNEYIDKSVNELFSLAQKKIDEGRYSEAKEYINSIPETLDITDDGKSLLEDIDNRIKEGDYETAISEFDSGNYEKARDIFIVLDGYKDSKSYLYDIGLDYYNNAETLYNEENYLGCMEQLEMIDEQNEWTDYQVSNELKQSAQDAYFTTIENDAIAVLTEQGYDSFVEYVNAKTDDVWDEEEKNKLIASYEYCKPLYLAEMELYTSKLGMSNSDDSFDDLYDAKIDDTFGNQYDHSIAVHQYTWMGDDDKNIEYLINGSYTHLTGEIAYIISDNEIFKDGCGYVEIEADGKTLFSSGRVDKNTAPIHFDIDLGEDVHIVSIRWYNMADSGPYECFIGLCTPTVYNLP